MNLIADASGSSSDLRMQGFIALAVATVVLLSVPLYLLVSPPDFLARERPAIVLAAGGAVIVLLTLGMVLKGKGMLFKIPLRFYDEALLIQPVLGLNPAIVPYREIASLELWWGLPYKRAPRGCSVLSTHYSVTSVETFTDKESLRKFAEKVRPVLEQSGLKLSSADDEAGSLHYTFHRDIRKRGRPGAWAPL